MTTLPFGDFRPDVSDLNQTYTRNIANAVPRADGWGPFQSFAPFTQSLPAQCRGGFFAYDLSSGSVVLFGATSTDLFKLDNTSLAWTKISKGGVAYPELSTGALWQFAQFNNFVFATQANAPLQVYDLQTPATFTDQAGSPPQAAYIAIISQFVVLSGLLSSPFTIQWSGLADPTNWAPGVNEGDLQNFADGGPVRGVVGGELSGYVFQDSAIRQMIFVPGSDIIFQITKIAKDVGLMAPYSLVDAGGNVCFLSRKGFMRLNAGVPVPIGFQRVDQTFFKTFDASAPQYMVGIGGPESNLVIWSYKTQANSAQNFDQLLLYDLALDRWAPVSMRGDYLLQLAKPGTTLEGLDAISVSLDMLPFSLDSISNATLPQTAMFGPSDNLGFFTGPSLEATLQTSEQSAIRQRIFVGGFYPLTDADACFGSVTTRENLKANPIISAEAPLDARGFVPLRRDTRHTRARLRIPAGTQWTFATGVDPDIQQTGKR